MRQSSRKCQARFLLANHLESWYTGFPTHTNSISSCKVGAAWECLEAERSGCSVGWVWCNDRFPTEEGVPKSLRITRCQEELAQSREQLLLPCRHPSKQEVVVRE